MMRIELFSAKAFASVAGLGLIVTVGAAAQGRGGENTAGKTAGEIYKNVQVLKDVPADQITPSMRVIARDLGGLDGNGLVFRQRHCNWLAGAPVTAANIVASVAVRHIECRTAGYAGKRPAFKEGRTIDAQAALRDGRE